MGKNYKKSDIMFASISLILVLTMTYKFSFGSTVYQTGSVLGDENSGEKSSSDSDSQSSKSDVKEKSTDNKSSKNSISTTSEKSTQASTKSEYSTQKNIMNIFRTKTTTEKSTKYSLEKSTDEFSTDLNDDKITTSSGVTVKEETKFEIKFNDNGQEIKTKTKIERLFLLLPVEIESEIILDNEGIIVEEKKTLIGQILDFFSF